MRWKWSVNLYQSLSGKKSGMWHPYHFNAAVYEEYSPSCTLAMLLEDAKILLCTLQSWCFETCWEEGFLRNMSLALPNHFGGCIPFVFSNLVFWLSFQHHSSVTSSPRNKDKRYFTHLPRKCFCNKSFWCGSPETCDNYNPVFLKNLQ